MQSVDIYAGMVATVQTNALVLAAMQTFAGTFVTAFSSPYLRPYQWLVRPDILSLLTIYVMSKS